MNGFIQVPRIGFIAASYAGQLNVTDLLGRNLEIVFLVFTELERIAAQNQRAGESNARAVTMIDRDFHWCGQIERLTVAFSHPGGKLLHQVLIGKLAKMLNCILVIEGNQHDVSSPSSLQSSYGVGP